MVRTCLLIHVLHIGILHFYSTLVGIINMDWNECAGKIAKCVSAYDTVWTMATWSCQQMFLIQLGIDNLENCS